MTIEDRSPEDCQAVIDRINRARSETPELLRSGRCADAFGLIYCAGLIDPESMELALRLAHGTEERDAPRPHCL